MIPLDDMQIEHWNQPHYSSVTSEDQSCVQGDIYSFGTNAAIHHNQMIVEEDTTTVSLNVFSDGEGCALTPTNLNRYCLLYLRKLTEAEGAGRKPSEACTIHTAEKEP